MQLPDEAIELDFSGFLVEPTGNWSPLAELQSQHLLAADRVETLRQQLMNARMQVASERDAAKPIEAGFIDLPQKLLDQNRRKPDSSEIARILEVANGLRGRVDRIVVLGDAGGRLGADALFSALCPAHHNDLPMKNRMGTPRFCFAGDGRDNDSFQELIDFIENTCVDPELAEERWGMVVVGKSGGGVAGAAAYRLLRKELTRFYGTDFGHARRYVAVATGRDGRLRELGRADGFTDEEIPFIPDTVSDRFSVFSAAGLLPAALMGLDIRALLLGAATMTRRFLEESLERNPVLQLAAINYLAATELKKPARVLALWSNKLTGLGRWYEMIVGESLSKESRGSTPMAALCGRDGPARLQHLCEGPRDKAIFHLTVKSPQHAPIPIGMADRNEDDLNAISRKTLADMANASHRSARQACRESARPFADIILPALSEHTLGQLMQLIMLATVVEARLMGINPYSQPAADAHEARVQAILRNGTAK